MKPCFRLSLDPLVPEGIGIHPATAELLGISIRGNWSLSFGLLSCPVEIHTSYQVGPEEMKVSPSIADALGIPLYCRYEVVIEGSSIIIGPFIAIIPEKTADWMHRRVRTERRTNVSLFHFIEHYDEIGGAILAFSEDGANPSRQRIQGYMYNPEKKVWEPGNYPYPAALFIKARVDKETEKHFQSKMGAARIFNNPVFDKWEMHNRLDSLPQLRSFLPETILYRKPKDIYKLLSHHGAVYIKPVTGENGVGVWKVVKKRDGIQVRFYENESNREYHFKTASEADSYFENSLSPGQVIVQQALDLFSIRHRIIDFRLILVKNQTGQWRDMGLYARYGKPDCVISNMNAGAEAEIGENALRKSMRLSKFDAEEIRKRMSFIGLSVARMMNRETVRCGNLGLDVALDKNLRLWIIEVNQVDPGHSIAKKVGLTKIYYQIRLANMLYAKRLAGFTK